MLEQPVAGILADHRGPRLRFVLLLRPALSTLFPYTTLFRSRRPDGGGARRSRLAGGLRISRRPSRSEEHTSELQSRGHLVCRLLPEIKNTIIERTATFAVAGQTLATVHRSGEPYTLGFDPAE